MNLRLAYKLIAKVKRFQMVGFTGLNFATRNNVPRLLDVASKMLPDKRATRCGL